MNAYKIGSRLMAFLLTVILVFPLALTGQEGAYGSSSVDVKAAGLDTDQLALIVIVPDVVTLVVGQRQVFTAEGRDGEGNPYPLSNPEWTLYGICGVITPDGATCTFDPTCPGSWTLVVRELGTPIFRAVDIEVNPTPLTTIEVSPSPVYMNVGEHQTFTATGKDSGGGTATIHTPIWETSGGGTLTPNGTTATYTAEQDGDFTVTCREGATEISGTASIHTTAAPPRLETIEVSPSPVYMPVGEHRTFTASGKDQYGENYPLSSPVWDATGGTVTQLGQYSAGNLPGRYWVTVVQGQVKGRAWVSILGGAPPDLTPGQTWEHTFC